MHVGDWVNAATNIFFGVLLGVVIKGLVDLTSTHFWTVAVVILLGAVTLEFFDKVLDKVLGKVFPGGIRSARKSQNGRAPLPRRLSLPAGLAIGFILAHLGLGSAVIGWIA